MKKRTDWHNNTAELALSTATLSNIVISVDANKRESFWFTTSYSIVSPIINSRS